MNIYHNDLERSLTEANDLLAQYEFSDILKNFLTGASSLYGSPRPWSRYGQASRELRILRIYFSDSSIFSGLERETIEHMVALQEVFPIFNIDKDEISKHEGTNFAMSVSHLDVLTEKEILLCQALRTTNEVFRRRFIEGTFVNDFQDNVYLAQKLEDVRTQTNLSKEDFFAISKFWFALFVGSRTQFAHPNESTQGWQFDLDWMLDSREMSRNYSNKKLLFSSNIEKELEKIKSEFLRI